VFLSCICLVIALDKFTLYSLIQINTILSQNNTILYIPPHKTPKYMTGVFNKSPFLNLFCASRSIESLVEKLQKIVAIAFNLCMI